MDCIVANLATRLIAQGEKEKKKKNHAASFPIQKSIL